MTVRLSRIEIERIDDVRRILCHEAGAAEMRTFSRADLISALVYAAPTEDPQALADRVRRGRLGRMTTLGMTVSVPYEEWPAA